MFFDFCHFEVAGYCMLLFHCCVLQGAALIFDRYSREIVPVSMNFTGSTRVFFRQNPTIVAKTKRPKSQALFLVFL